MRNEIRTKKDKCWGMKVRRRRVGLNTLCAWRYTELRSCPSSGLDTAPLCSSWKSWNMLFEDSVKYSILTYIFQGSSQIHTKLFCLFKGPLLPPLTESRCVWMRNCYHCHTGVTGQAVFWKETHNHSAAYISEVLRVGEVGQVSVVELLTFQVVAVLARPEVTGFDATGLQELLIGHSERLTNSLGDDLSLHRETGKWRENRFRFWLSCYIHIWKVSFWGHLLNTYSSYTLSSFVFIWTNESKWLHLKNTTQNLNKALEKVLFFSIKSNLFF